MEFLTYQPWKSTQQKEKYTAFFVFFSIEVLEGKTIRSDYNQETFFLGVGYKIFGDFKKYAPTKQ